MAIWKGWDTQLLAELGAPDTAENRRFLEQWAATGTPDCKNNPLGATLAELGSSRCRRIAAGVFVQAYPSRKQGVAATVKQLHAPPANALLAALKTGAPFTDPNWPLVEGGLGTWGAHAFAVKYGQEAQAALVAESEKAAKLSDATRSLAGYSHLSHVMSRSVPARLGRIDKMHREALAILRRGH